MATRGPKPKQKSAVAPGPMPDPPEWMDENDRALKLWSEFGPALNQLGLLESLDAVAFSLLCEAIDAYLHARDQLSADDLVILVGAKYDKEGQCIYDGSPQQNPLVSIVRQQTKAIRELLVEFGMTPGGRIRLTGSTSVKPDAQTKDPLEALAERMGQLVVDPPAKTKPTARKRKRKAKPKPRTSRKTSK